MATRSVSGAIPARAGRTLGSSRRRGPCAGHPCACRENTKHEFTCAASIGPSLRVQGERAVGRNRGGNLGAIPARAGRTSLFRGCCCCAGHPCACRENSRGLGLLWLRPGPSLRVQGELRQDTPTYDRVRAIPARAGRTARSRMASGSSTGHPCACRENGAAGRGNPSRNGPSLRVQGEHQDASGYMKIKRAIPARAGRTRARSDVARPRMGHPCACRENVLGEWKELPTSGPSLRVQGEPPWPITNVENKRAIPARAGRTNPFISGFYP